MDPFAKILSDYSPARRKQDTTTIAKLMLHCHKNDLFCMYIIAGPRGAGKSTYALMSLDHAYRVLLKDRSNKCHFDVERHVIFDAVKFFELVQTQYEEKMERCSQSDNFIKCINKDKELGIIFDDAGILVGTSLWFEERDLYFQLVKIFDVIRPLVSNLILTVPTMRRLATFIRETEDVYLVNVYPLLKNREFSIAEIWSTPRYSVVRQKMYRKKLVEEIFPLRTVCYEEYLPLRMAIIEKVIRDIQFDEEKSKKLLEDM